MNRLTLRAFDVRDGWAIVEGPAGELWLVTPPYRDAGRQRISPEAERQLRQHGDFPGADERFLSWGDLTRALVQRRLQAAGSTAVPSPTQEARQLLKGTPAHRIDGLVSQAEALLEQGRYGAGGAGLADDSCPPGEPGSSSWKVFQHFPVSEAPGIWV